ncbi:GNAT family N-acetyltransferase [Heliobacterium undosum]|uniref:GNAT family N-acetyltransferase n=1 Tax=Heliomicrobium undosum TaxID=121734 RepID=A0A845L7S3_9FIRM|nr:GNAT family N-acetyltransferase [Heliomicrobium undosum]MZP30680.1 GNAT family N-acetyltransferase [Heliomicrobium undosum]
MGKYLYRMADKSDVAGLVELEALLLEEIIQRTHIAHFQIDQAEIQRNIEQFIETQKMWFFIAVDDAGNGRQCVGFIGLTEAHALYTHGKYGIITEFYVRNAYRDKGVGNRLLQEALQFAQMQEWKRFEVTTPPLPEFENSLRFYTKNGFSITGGRKLKAEEKRQTR